MLKNPLLKNSMNFGLITALVLVIFNLIFYVIFPTQQTLLGILTYIVLIVMIFIGTKFLRDNMLGGYISYGKSVASGVLISLCVSVIIAFYVFTFYKLDPHSLEKIIELQEEELYKRGLPEDEIEKSIEIISKFTTPTTLAIGTILNYILLGTLFSLIIGAFTKKNEPEFQRVIKEIEENNNTTQNNEQQ
ncbi:MAG: DUF4199 domain-containing protein [Bacteroidales bacterium]|nr:DUF4199 domain-containing protein [Bacteroidales bacterium]